MILVGIVTVEHRLLGSSRYVTPSVAGRSTSRTVSPIAHAAHVELEVVGDLQRERFDVDLAVDLRARLPP